jgi:hypothetical protein
MKAFTFVLIVLFSVPSLGKDTTTSAKPTATPKPNITVNLQGISSYKDSKGQTVACQVYLEMDELERIISFRAETNSVTRMGAFSGFAISILEKALAPEGEPTMKDDLNESLNEILTHEAEFPVSMDDAITQLAGREDLTPEEVAAIRKEIKLKNEASKGQLFAQFKVGGLMFNEDFKLKVKRDRKTQRITSVEFEQSVKEGMKMISQVACENLQPMTTTAARLEDKTTVISPETTNMPKSEARN